MCGCLIFHEGSESKPLEWIFWTCFSLRLAIIVASYIYNCFGVIYFIQRLCGTNEREWIWKDHTCLVNGNCSDDLFPNDECIKLATDLVRLTYRHPLQRRWPFHWLCSLHLFPTRIFILECMKGPVMLTVNTVGDSDSSILYHETLSINNYRIYMLLHFITFFVYLFHFSFIVVCDICVEKWA